MPTTARALIVVAALVAGACSSAPADDTTPTSGLALPSVTSTEASTASSVVEPGETEGPMFDPGRCPFDAPDGTSPICGTVTVPENREDPDGASVTLAVARFPARNDNATAPPLVYLEGGPGGEILEAIGFAYEPIFRDLNESRELILFDQRGTGFSEPALGCQELVDLGFELLDEVVPTEELIPLRLDALQPCVERWQAAGIDLSQYNSAASASDVADLRRALGVDEWDLYGVSYGTRLALTVMRDHPEGVRSVILDSTYPPEVDGVSSILGTADRALDELYAGCAAQETCQEAFGDLEELLFDVVDTLNAEPASAVVTDLFTLDRYDAVIDGDTVLDLVFQALYSEDLFADVPQMLQDLADGSTLKAELLLSLLLANQEFFAIGQNFSVQCHEEVPYGDPAAAESVVDEFPRLASLVDGAFTQSSYAFEFCEQWNAGVGDPIEALPVVSDIPTLVVAGQYDPITPPAFGEAVAERLANATFVEYPGLGHGVATGDGCPLSITLSFLDDPAGPIDASCVETMPPASFRVLGAPGEVTLQETEIEMLGELLTVLVPSDWEDLTLGTFYRSTSNTDPTALIVQGASQPGLGTLIVNSIAGQLTDDGEIDEIDSVAVDGRTWRRFAEEARGVQLDIAIYEDASSTISVVLVSDPRERDTLLDTVFFPAMESVALNP